MRKIASEIVRYARDCIFRSATTTAPNEREHEFTKGPKTNVRNQKFNKIDFIFCSH